ncbi:Sjogren's syndrome/scleroderma autoantigen 1 family protein [Haloferax namakaokahaiae]|uniref:Sjogren's syndrome/scleroderma autoantigen 1 family protein n=1 Tax=Haloferax namakaokahaiae TaxID=1748331 RepID=A0ABD5ZJH5_9EURY
MSDFDKEKERQRLREKYERDEQKRDSTQRMSELLLKGATMTNKHCPQCGDPLFRYNGQEFCPSCQAEGQQASAADADAASAAEEVATEVVSDGKSTAPRPVERSEHAESETPAQTAEGSASAPPQQGRTQQPGQQSGQQPTQRQRTGDASLSAARESLVETLTWAANEAAKTDDPHRAKEYLAAAREAAKALAALDR